MHTMLRLKKRSAELRVGQKRTRYLLWSNAKVQNWFYAFSSRHPHKCSWYKRHL